MAAAEPWPKMLEVEAMELVTIAEITTSAMDRMIRTIEKRHNYLIVPELMPVVVSSTKDISSVCNEMANAIIDTPYQQAVNAYWYKLITSDLHEYLRTCGESRELWKEWCIFELYRKIDEAYSVNKTAVLMERLRRGLKIWNKIYKMILKIPFHPRADVPEKYDENIKRRSGRGSYDLVDDDAESPPPQSWSFVW